MNIPRDKKFYEHGRWAEILKETPFQELYPEMVKQFVRDSMEDGYRWEYYRTLEWTGEDGPDWEDLTDEQRENIRESQREHMRDMQNFGKAIASGDTDEIDAAGKKLAGL